MRTCSDTNQSTVMKNNRARIKDIAHKAGVSTGTVDRVLHNRGNVGREARNKVLAAMDELGYERNLIASALAFNRQIRIVALLPDHSLDPYWEQPYRGVQWAQQALKHYGIAVETIFFNLFSPEDFIEQSAQVLHNPPDGLLFPPLFGREGSAVLDNCEKIKLPVVIINTFLEHPHITAYIGQDSFQSGVLAARLLNFALRAGEPALILNLEKGVTNALHLMEKERGFRYYFANHPHQNIEVFSSNFDDFDNRSKLKAYLSTFTKGPSQVGGIFVTNSRAYKVIDCLEEEDLHKFVIVGFDLIPANIRHLSTNRINFLINQNPIEQGYQGIISLYKLLFLKEIPPGSQFLPLDIVVAENMEYYLKQQDGAMKVI